MTSGKSPFPGVDTVRRADAYPRALKAARLYFGGLAWGMASALIIGYSDLSSWFFLFSAIAVPLIWVGVLAARDAWSRLEQELPNLPEPDIRSISIFATVPDLLRRRNKRSDR